MRLNRISAVRRAAAAIGILAVPVVGISLIPAQNSPADSSSHSCAGSCKPNPTVTQHHRSAVSPTPSATGHAHHSHPSATATGCPQPGPTVTQYVHVPGPTVTRYRYRYISPTATSTP